MKRVLSNLTFILACGLLVGGCVTTNYPVITDNSQTRNGGDGIIPSSASAHQFETLLVATIFADGSVEIINEVDQKTNGDQTWTSHQHYNPAGSGGPTFHWDTYCNPGSTGCNITTAPNPLTGDSDIFDYSWNQNCDGSRALSLLVSYGARSAECGKAGLDAGKMGWGNLSVSEVLDLSNTIGEDVVLDGETFTRFTLTPEVVQNFTVEFADGSLESIPVPEAGISTLCNMTDGTLQVQCKVNMTDPVFAPYMHLLQDLADTYGATEITRISATVAGYELNSDGMTFQLVTEPGFYTDKLEHMTPYVEVPGLERPDLSTGTIGSRRRR